MGRGNVLESLIVAPPRTLLDDELEIHTHSVECMLAKQSRRYFLATFGSEQRIKVHGREGCG